VSGAAVPAGYRLGDGWRPVDLVHGYVCTDVKGNNGLGGDHGALYMHADGERGACADHAVSAGALIKTSTPEPCSCEESLALRAEIREAAAHVGDLLALGMARLSKEQARKRDAAREWLKAYLAKGGA